MPDPCPICGEIDCGGFVYPYMLSEHVAGRNRDHWKRIHDGKPGAPAAQPSPEDLALRAYVAKRPCCG